MIWLPTDRIGVAALLLLLCFSWVLTGQQDQRQYELVSVKNISSSKENSHQNSTLFIFTAFNRTFVLEVEPCAQLLSSSFHILTFTNHLTKNSSLHVENGYHLRECVYKGSVRDYASSIVSLNVCGGLRGFIHTSDFDLEIQPYISEYSNIHKVYKLNEQKSSSCHLNKTKIPPFSKFPQRAKRSVSNEWNLETMVVADSRVRKYHGDNLEMYILTLMASVALLYKDPSIGNNINIIIVKLIIFSEEEDKGIIYPSASKTLRNFCRWQSQLRDSEVHDTAILLTRVDLCRYSQTCDTLGLAQSGMACEPGSSCAVVEDNGLSAAFTIAHEIGHILGVPHDDDTKCERFHKPGQRLNVMARMLDYNSYPHSWSECSRHFFTSFLDGGYGHCLLTQSSRDLLAEFEHANTLPGELYDMDYQCELVYGKGSRICPYMPACKRLWCTMEDISQGGCRTQHMPWADGTRCGPENSCFEGECVKDPVSLVPKNGEWGEWQHYGSCSRTCGGGVARSVRYCDNPKPSHGGQFCVGDRVRYKSCNTQDCPVGGTDFRKEQCSAFNGKTFGFSGIKENVEWVPHFSEIGFKDRCKLYCRAAGTAAYFLLKEKAIDGTTCGPDTFDICINGKCMAAGCDHVLNSVKVLDSCGVCGGDGSSCQVMRGKYAPTTAIRYGYNNVLKIPAGSSNIKIIQNAAEKSADDNYLALKGVDGNYILNGNFMISMFPKSVEYAGCLFDYSGSSIPTEKINASKSLQKDLEVEVLTVGALLSPDIYYEYTSSVFWEVRYRWRLATNWQPCNSMCQGEQYRKAICVNESNGQEVNEEMCHGKQRPAHEARACNLSCTLRWRTRAISSCSSVCGPGLIRSVVECAQIHKSGEIQIIPSNYCGHIEPKPSELKECMGTCTKKEWIYGEWSECSASCGTGTQRRTARCIGDSINELPDFACNETKVTEKVCVGDCPKWKFHDWEECSVTCGSGWRNRRVFCEYEGSAVASNRCDASKRLSERMPCELEKCDLESENGVPIALLPSQNSVRITYLWVVGNWSVCSVTCGSGTQTRHVSCMGQSTMRNDDVCDPLLKPRANRICRNPPCSHSEKSSKHSEVGMWRTGLWGKCSKSCGGGVRRRQVLCFDDDGRESDACKINLKPTDTSPCNDEPCPEWKLGSWSECSATCGKGIQRRKIWCINHKEIMLPDNRCHEPSPIQEKRCKRAPCFKWSWSTWSSCSNNCNVTTQSRFPQCHRGSRRVDDKLCNQKTKPDPEVRFCNRQRCKIHWEKKLWSKCSGNGFKYREVKCVNGKHEEIDKRFCSHLRKPKSRRKCHRFKCSMTWIAGEWSECSQTCGPGFETRSVACHRVNSYHWIEPQPVTESEYGACNQSEKPHAKRSCNLGECTGNVWKVGPWLPCSVTCGRGQQRRRVPCYTSAGKRVPNINCNKQNRPQRKKQCYPRPCAATSCLDFKNGANITDDGEQSIFVRGKYVKLYCARMNTSSPQEYITLPKGEQDNYSEVYAQRLKNASTCPNRGARFDYCDCETADDIKAGLTSFQKIAINLTTLSVITHDFAFSQTHKGHSVPYAESGDCYSKESCPQGRFSLSLVGTGFIVSQLTKFTAIGNYSSNRIRWLEGGQVIQGKCGGYCSRCSANIQNGLLLDVAPP